MPLGQWLEGRDGSEKLCRVVWGWVVVSAHSHGFCVCVCVCVCVSVCVFVCVLGEGLLEPSWLCGGLSVSKQWNLSPKPLAEQ